MSAAKAPRAAALPAGFSHKVIDWQKAHGRHALPWQNTRDPYRVWLSEIMLQQTQVAAVLGYYERFLARFPDVAALAAAHEDEVLAMWSGLGYYSRARNLHRCAQEVVARHGGRFPPRAAELADLPGIGRSTAAAIASFCFGERVAILDGNVKRVLSRVLAFDADLASAANERALWAHADALLPTHDLAENMPRYTQGIMDLGATLCLPRKPACLLCPVRDVCRGAAADPERFPVKTRKLRRSAEAIWLLDGRREDGAAWLQRRPAPGVWAGLYCPPLFDSREALLAALPRRAEAREAEPFVHVLTHKDLHLHPVRVALPTDWEREGGAWYAPTQWEAIGLPTPVRKLLAAG